MELKQTNKVRHIITLTTGQYDHLYNIMCSQDEIIDYLNESDDCLLYTSPSPRDLSTSRMPSSA